MSDGICTTCQGPLDSQDNCPDCGPSEEADVDEELAEDGEGDDDEEDDDDDDEDD